MTQGRNILIVEDSPTQAQLFEALLKKQGFAVRIAVNGVQCFQQINTQQPDAIFLDVNLPGGMNGYQICQRLKRDPKTAHIPVIILSEATKPDDIKRGYDSGARGYIAKGAFTESHLTMTLNNMEL